MCNLSEEFAAKELKISHERQEALELRDEAARLLSQSHSAKASNEDVLRILREGEFLLLCSLIVRCFPLIIVDVCVQNVHWEMKLAFTLLNSGKF